MKALPPVEIALSVHNGAPFLPEQIRSLQAQTHGEWRLWVRDDGSDDGSGAVVEALSASDPRIHLLPGNGDRLGAARGFGWVLERLPRDAAYVFCCDADDVWLPEKIRMSLDRFLAMEETTASRGPRPLLLHTDLTVVDRELRVLDPSLWHALGIHPEPAHLHRLLVQNVATGPTLLLNRALVDHVLPVPREAIHQDWWMALVAAAVGRIEALSAPTVFYRRHGANQSGVLPARRTPARVGRAWANRGGVARWVDATARQAGALLERVGPLLSSADRAWVEGHASIPHARTLHRKRLVARHLTLPEYGALKNLGIVARG